MENHYLIKLTGEDAKLLEQAQERVTTLWGTGASLHQTVTMGLRAILADANVVGVSADTLGHKPH